jgi:virulence-associated protein VagC
MKIANIVNDSDSQTVELPVGAEFPPHVSKLIVSVVGLERILHTAPHKWDSFFRNASTEDFMQVRASQQQGERESL